MNKIEQELEKGTDKNRALRWFIVRSGYVVRRRNALLAYSTS